ncbi:Multidrug resistance-associated protein 4 [Stylophora pistillata]|uniref:Multidrug resistance-associated protein 4 n=1 Tax=Stylophora pistillata TaxID=50429 RepID=A0A2B4S395_STYPI|nr:Multidrug resistance-associated protein 4 [Stylophora pistillata]
MNGVLKEGSQRPLDQSDFLPLSDETSGRFVTEKLRTSWESKKHHCKIHGKRSKLWKSVFDMLSVKDVIIILTGNVLYTTSRLLFPLFLGYFVSMLMSAEAENTYLICACALAMCLNGLIGGLGMHQQDYKCEVLGIKIGSALRGLVYHKTLLLSKQTLLEFTAGRLFDLISNDVKRMEEETVKFFFLTPFAVLSYAGTIFLIYSLIGWQATTGVFFLCILIPYFAVLSYASAKLRLRTATVSDQRISLMNQVVSGIRAVKTHAWEDEYRRKTKDIRRNEISVISKRTAIQSSLDALLYSATPLATLVSVITMVLTGQTLTPANVFMLLSFMGFLKLGGMRYVIYGFLTTYDAYVSLERIEEFLLLENLSAASEGDESKKRQQKVESTSTKQSSSCLKKEAENMENVSLSCEATELGPTDLCVSNLTCAKNHREDEVILQDINFVAPSKSLTVITGPVGSGKSTLLSAIAGEISDTSGTIFYRGNVIYLPQTAWVFSGTIKENILFGQPYEESMYERIIEVCALKEDFQRLPDGDQTVVGERGEVLSGGQQARVSLARAVYADGDFYLLDDPLSAVDFKVGQHIFNKCIKNLLADKTVLLTSHQQQHMENADEVIVLYKGHVLGKGRFIELQGIGVINATFDPLYKETLEDKTESSETFAWEDTEKHDDAEKCQTIHPLPNEARSLEIAKEDRTIGVVTSKLYWDYFRSGAHPLMITGMVVLILITQAVLVAPDLWLSFLARLIPEDQKNRTFLSVFACLVGACFIFTIIRAYGFLLLSLKCAERLHDKMVVAILQAPVLFFDSNPVGRILNRFSNDIGCVDELLPKTFLWAIQVLLLIFFQILVTVATNFWLVFVVVPISVLVVVLSNYYLKTARELKRLESISRSPVFAHFSDTLVGLDTIRTRGRQTDFVAALYRYQDVHKQAYIMVIASGRWLGTRLDCLASLLVGAVALAAVLVSQDAASAGLALVYVIQTLNMTQYAVRKASEVENYMTSVERVMTYTKLDQEPGYEEDRQPPKDWPRRGSIVFRDVSLTYYPGGPQVLKEINLSIKGGEKIGVAGRTGAGKSSFVAALMRMPDADGEIIIDDVPIKEIGLQQARQGISVLGQSPVLFSGSLRKNLDILDRFQDAELWQALEDVQLKDFAERLEAKLDHELLEHGANVSVGERQLICLARVLLQRSKIVVLDEPTAHVDPDTEQTIWNVVRDKLKESTVITIAHRLNTIRDCHKILVLKDGKVDGFDKFDSIMNYN